MQICLFIIANIGSPACPWPANNEILIRIFSPGPCPELSQRQPFTLSDWINFEVRYQHLLHTFLGLDSWIHGFQDINLCQKRPDPPVWKWDVKHLNHKVAIILLDWLVHFCQLVPKYEYMTHHKYAMNQPTLHLYYKWMIDHRMLPKQFYLQYNILQVQPSGLI